MSEFLYVEKVAPWWMSLIAAVLGAAGVVLVTTSVATGAVVLVSAGVVFWFGRACYVVSTRGVEVRVGFGHPHLSIAAADISRVDASRSPWPRGGGWGYRGSWTLMNRVAISLGGRGWVDIETLDGRRLQLSTTDPEQLLAAVSTVRRG